MKIFKTSLLFVACTLALHANAALFEDDEARRAILDLRQKVDVSQQRTTDALKKSSDDNAQLRRSLLDLSSEIETLRSEMATLRGQNEQLTRSVTEMQRVQKDLTQGIDERLRKVEPSKVTVDGREFEHYMPEPYGAASNPLTDAALEEKFLGLAAPVLGAARARAALDALWTIDTRANVAEVAALLGG